VQFLKLIFFTVIFGTSSANALLLSDVYEVNAPLNSGEQYGFIFNIADHGYNHLTDTITGIKLGFDFREMVEMEENLEDIKPPTNVTMRPSSWRGLNNIFHE
jgi:hypothetical protein